MGVAELFRKLNPGTFKLEAVDPKDVWILLLNSGYQIHPDLEQLYIRQKECIWCGGAIITIQGATPESWEIRCEKCDYLYGED